MTFADRVTAIIAAAKGQQTTSQQAITDAKAAQDAAETKLADYVALVGDVPTLAADITSLEQAFGITPPTAG